MTVAVRPWGSGCTDILSTEGEAAGREKAGGGGGEGEGPQTTVQQRKQLYGVGGKDVGWVFSTTSTHLVD